MIIHLHTKNIHRNIDKPHQALQDYNTDADNTENRALEQFFRFYDGPISERFKRIASQCSTSTVGATFQRLDECHGKTEDESRVLQLLAMHLSSTFRPTSNYE